MCREEDSVILEVDTLVAAVLGLAGEGTVVGILIKGTTTVFLTGTVEEEAAVTKSIQEPFFWHLVLKILRTNAFYFCFRHLFLFRVP